LEAGYQEEIEIENEASPIVGGQITPLEIKPTVDPKFYMFGSSITAVSFMTRVKLLKNHILLWAYVVVFALFVTDNFCLRTSCNIHCQDTSTTGRHFHRKGEIAMKRRIFLRRGELLVSGADYYR